MTVDDIELDDSNIEFKNAVDFIKHTNKLVYLTGKAGTGKTTFLKYIKTIYNNNTVVLAPTGIAALNAGGQTIHSFFRIAPSIYVPNDKRLRTNYNSNDNDRSTIYDHFNYSNDKIELIRALKLLIIDEISMVRCDLLDVVDRLLRVYRKREFEPFGGVQVILIGDTFQLPPIADFEQWEIMKKFYDSPFFFSSIVIRNNKPIYIELKKIYRQKEDDFVQLLNKVRVNEVTDTDLAFLNSRYNPTFLPDKNSNYITLATTKRIVDTTNTTKLEELFTELKIFLAQITGTFPENIMPTDKELKLKEGAQIMFIKNDKQKRYVNGTIGKIITITENNITIEYTEKNNTDRLILEKDIFKNIKYSWNEKEKKINEEIIGTFTQFPIKLAWAITVHKSQGLTLDNVIADVGSAFASGQVYVALSRCTTLSGLVLKTRIERSAIKTDNRVIEFAKNEIPNTLIVQELNTGRADLLYKNCREAFLEKDFVSAYDNFIKAIKFRNDIETDDFKRYFITHSKKLSNYKFLLSNLLTENEKIKTENSDLEKKYIKSEVKNVEDKKKLNEQNTSLELIIAKLEKDKNKNEEHIEEIENDVIKQRYLIAQKENDIKEKNDYLKDAQNKINDLESDKNNSEKIIEELKFEIYRLQNIKWHQKLLGKT